MVAHSRSGVRASTRSASRTRVDDSTDPRTQKILRELRSKRRESTPRLFPVADCNPEPRNLKELDVLFAEWLTQIESEIAPETWKTYQGYCTNHFLPVL